MQRIRTGSALRHFLSNNSEFTWQPHFCHCTCASLAGQILACIPQSCHTVYLFYTACLHRAAATRHAPLQQIRITICMLRLRRGSCANPDPWGKQPQRRCVCASRHQFQFWRTTSLLCAHVHMPIFAFEENDRHRRLRIHFSLLCTTDLTALCTRTYASLCPRRTHNASQSTAEQRPAESAITPLLLLLTPQSIERGKRFCFSMSLVSSRLLRRK